MNIVSALAISLSLAADAMTAAVCCGLKSRGNYRKKAVLTAVLFGFFQMLMAVLGWSIGRVGVRLISGKEGIAAFGILLLAGVKMLWDSRREPTSPLAVVTGRELLLFAVATSMDALALGTVLPVAVHADTALSLTEAVLMIGAVTFALSFCGFRFGHHFQRLSPRWAAFCGGCLLILLGGKILLFG